jgi:hypothetical protein
MAGVPVTVVISAGGGTLANAPVLTSSGPTSVGQWTMGNTVAVNSLTISAAGVAPLVVTVTSLAGPLSGLSVMSGDAQVALAGRQLATPIAVAAVDQFGNRIGNQTVMFSIGAGGGSVALGSATSGADGLVTAPAWTLGKSAVPQQLIATIGPVSVTLTAAVQTSYVIDVRFWGSVMTSEQQALFTEAAARIRGAVVGGLPMYNANGADPSLCGVAGVPPLSENIPGVIIYASIQNIDGKGQVLARAGPCYIRSSTDVRTAIGVMEFDAADIGSLGDRLVDVIVHEMLHVVGVGSLWAEKGLVQNAGTPTVAYTGASGVQGCRETGGSATCAFTVPIENTGGAGTAGGHWRESTFADELMTGFINAGANPLSVMTVRSIEDLGYSTNASSADPYLIATGSLRQDGSAALATPEGVEWERGLSRRPIPLPVRVGALRDDH